MHLQRLNITNVRQFQDRTFTFLPGFNLLVGENGAGKTTLLRSVAAVLGPTRGRYEIPILIDDDISLNARQLQIDAQVLSPSGGVAFYSYDRHWGARASRRHTAEFPLILIYGSNESVCTSFVAKRMRITTGRLGELTDSLDEEWLYKETERTRTTEDAISENRFGDSREIRDFISRILSIFSPKFRNFRWVFEPYQCTVRQRAPGPGDLETRYKRLLANTILRYLTESKRAFFTAERSRLTIDSSGKLLNEKSENESRMITPSFRELLRDFAETKLQESSLKDFVADIRLTPRIQLDTPAGPMLLSQLSDGEKRLFSVFVDIARQLSLACTPESVTTVHQRSISSVPAIVLIDEIDVHLHPKWQRLIVPSLEDLFPACQFIATTHSPFVVQGVEESQVQHLEHSLVGDFTDRGIEEIAAKVMGIEDPDVSPRYLDMLKAAKRYFSLIESAAKDLADGDGAAVTEAKQEMDRLTARYARNPAYQAFLELNRDLRLGRGDLDEASE